MSDRWFYIILMVAVAVYLVRVNRRRRAAYRSMPPSIEGARQGPVPGYSLLPGKALQWNPVEAPPIGLGETWEVTSVETVHAGRRTRWVLTLRALQTLEPTQQFTIMKALAERILRHTMGLVAAVQFQDSPNNAPDAMFVLSRDGRGWTGTAQGVFITARLPGRTDFRVEVARAAA